MMIKKMIIILLCSVHIMYASFLKTDDTADSFGLGSGGSSYLQGSSVSLLNPASTSSKNSYDIVLSQYFSIESTAMSYMGITKGNSAIGTYGLFVKGLYPLEKIVRLNDQGESTGEEIGFLDYLVGINYNYNLITVLKGDLYAGINLKYINQKLWTYKSYGVGSDIGLLYASKAVQDLRIGLAYHNLGVVLKDYLNENNDYPESLQIGISFSDNILINKFNAKRNLFFIFDLILSEQQDADYFCAGMEYRLMNFMDIHAGYKLRIGAGMQDVDYLRNFRAGLGINWALMRITYSFAPKSNVSNQFLNFFTLRFKF